MIKKAVLITGLALMLGSANVWAMEKGQHGRGGPGKMARIEDLTGDQKAKLKAIGEAQKAEMQPVHEKATAIVKELKSLIDSKAGDAAITAKLDELKKVRAQMQDLKMKYMEQREAVFTPTQRAQMALKMAETMKEGRGQNMDGRGMKHASEGAPEGKK